MRYQPIASVDNLPTMGTIHALTPQMDYGIWLRLLNGNTTLDSKCPDICSEVFEQALSQSFFVEVGLFIDEDIGRTLRRYTDRAW